MKYTYLISLFILLTGCKETTVNGYFLKNDRSSIKLYNMNNTYLRINQDTIVTYTIYNQTIDSLVFCWNGKRYARLGTSDDGVFEDFGSDKYIVIDENKLKFDASKSQKILDDSSYSTREEENVARINVFLVLDTIRRITKKYFYAFLDEDRKKDSILFNSPYIDDYTIKNTVSNFIKERIEGEVYGKLINNSIFIKRINDDSFKVSFKTISKYGNKQDHRFIFDGNMEDNWSIQRNR